MLDKTVQLPAAEWTEARVEDLKRFWAEGKSAGRIADELGGVSRNAVISKVHRLGVAGTAPKIKTPRVPNPLGRRIQFLHLSRAEKAERQRARALARILEKNQEPPTTPPAGPEFLNLAFDELQRGDCRFPLGAEPPFSYCGRPVITGASWCARCFSVVFQPRRRAA